MFWLECCSQQWGTLPHLYQCCVAHPVLNKWTENAQTNKINKKGKAKRPGNAGWLTFEDTLLWGGAEKSYCIL